MIAEVKKICMDDSVRYFCTDNQGEIKGSALFVDSWRNLSQYDVQQRCISLWNGLKSSDKENTSSVVALTYRGYEEGTYGITASCGKLSDRPAVLDKGDHFVFWSGKDSNKRVYKLGKDLFAHCKTKADADEVIGDTIESDMEDVRGYLPDLTAEGISYVEGILRSYYNGLAQSEGI